MNDRIAPVELTSSVRPTLRADAKGYVLGDESVDGFADRPDLVDGQRRIIARLAAHYAPDEVSAAQQEFLRDFEARGPTRPSELLLALAADEADVTEAYVTGFYDELSDESRRVVFNPSEHPELGGRDYPLSIGDVAKLTGATTRQLRHWEDSGLLRSHRVNGRRKFFAGAVLKAMVLAETPQYQLAAISDVSRQKSGGERLLRLIGAVVASLDPESVERAGRELIATGKALIEHSSELLQKPKKPAKPTRRRAVMSGRSVSREPGVAVASQSSARTTRSRRTTARVASARRQSRGTKSSTSNGPA
jgi:DNA-binding transcriptional MerR regulator